MYTLKKGIYMDEEEIFTKEEIEQLKKVGY